MRRKKKAGAINRLSTPKFIEEQLASGEKVKSIIKQTAYMVLRETLAFTDRRVIVHRSGFLHKSTCDYPYETISSIRAENTRPIECLIAFLVSIVGIAFYYTNIDLTWLYATDFPTTVYFSVIAGIISAAVIGYYVYRGWGRLKAIAVGGALFVILGGLWYYIHYMLPPLSQLLLNFFATSQHTSTLYLENTLIFEDFVSEVFSKIASDTAVIISTIYGIIALICFIVRLSLVLLNIEEGWDSITFHPYNPEIIKLIRAAWKP